jgi:hypothetical protein
MRAIAEMLQLGPGFSIRVSASIARDMCESYRDGWDWKRQWYSQNGYAEGRNLFTTTEEQIRDVDFIDKLAKTVQAELS